MTFNKEISTFKPYTTRRGKKDQSVISKIETTGEYSVDALLSTVVLETRKLLFNSTQFQARLLSQDLNPKQK